MLNTYSVLKAHAIIFTQDAIATMEQHFLKA
jgi:hypothetical protein